MEIKKGTKIVANIAYQCDNCKKEICDHAYLIPIAIHWNYDEDDYEEVHFCCINCMLTWWERKREELENADIYMSMRIEGHQNSIIILNNLSDKL